MDNLATPESVRAYAGRIVDAEYAMQTFAQKLERLGPRIMEEFFVTNAEYLIPA